MPTTRNALAWRQFQESLEDDDPPQFGRSPHENLLIGIVWATVKEVQTRPPATWRAWEVAINIRRACLRRRPPQRPEDLKRELGYIAADEKDLESARRGWDWLTEEVEEPLPPWSYAWIAQHLDFLPLRVEPFLPRILEVAHHKQVASRDKFGGPRSVSPSTPFERIQTAFPWFARDRILSPYKKGADV